MTKVYIIRHAESEGNIYRRMHGHYDSHITPRGRRQIEALIDRFKDVKFDAVYSSDLTRAKVTAECIAKDHHVNVIATKSLRECALGIWEDVTWGDVEWIEPIQYNNYLNDPANWSCAGNEKFYPMQRRMTKIIFDIINENDGKTVLIVTHGYALRSFMCNIYGYEAEEFTKIPHCDNASVTYMEVESNNVDLKYYADVSHLDENTSTLAHMNWWRQNASKDDRSMHFSAINGKVFDVYLGYLKNWYEMCGEEVNDYVIKDAMMRSAFNPKSIIVGYLGETPMGCIDVDAEHGRINFVYLEEQYRGRGLAVQFIGHAVNVCRDAGYDKLTVKFPDKFTDAVDLFKADYYETLDDTDGVITMVKDLAL